MKAFLSGLLLCSILIACKSMQKNGIPSADSSRTSLDWAGTYSGILPCADCEGIEQVITLNQNQTYTLKREYKGKADAIKTDSGSFKWNKSGSIITLNGLNPSSSSSMYQVGENRLTQLDLKGEKITGELAVKYQLIKMNTEILNKYWKLVELYGQPVTMSATDKKEPHIILHPDGNRLSGSGGCNNLAGTYELKPGNRIRFAQNMATTLLPCNDMEKEKMLIKVLQTADNYSLSGDSVMTLNKARMAPLARFIVVYLK